jgi:hypothetical protein
MDLGLPMVGTSLPWATSRRLARSRSSRSITKPSAMIAKPVLIRGPNAAAPRSGDPPTRCIVQGCRAEEPLQLVGRARACRKPQRARVRRPHPGVPKGRQPDCGRDRIRKIEERVQQVHRRVPQSGGSFRGDRGPDRSVKGNTPRAVPKEQSKAGRMYIRLLSNDAKTVSKYSRRSGKRNRGCGLRRERWPRWIGSGSAVVGIERRGRCLLICSAHTGQPSRFCAVQRLSQPLAKADAPSLSRRPSRARSARRRRARPARRSW